MLFLLAPLFLRMNLTNENHDEMVKLSRQMPTLGFFSQTGCARCAAVAPEWDRLESTYENDTTVLLIHCDCVQHPLACAKLDQIPHYPGFLLMFGGRLVHVRLEPRSYDHYADFVEWIRTWNSSVKCQHFVNQTNAFPFLELSLDQDESTACEKVQQIQARLPQFAPKIWLGRRSNQTIVKFWLEQQRSHFYEGDLESDDFVGYAVDFLHRSVGNWPVAESEKITRRRFGIYIFNETLQLHSVEDFAQNQSENFAFTRQLVPEFVADYPQISFAEEDIPAFAIFNREQTKFRLMKGIKFDGDLKEQFENLARLENDPEIVIPRKGLQEGGSADL
jgi:hypothetical protein